MDPTDNAVESATADISMEMSANLEDHAEPEESPAKTFPDKLRNVLIANEAYIQSLEACQALIAQYSRQKAGKEAVMREALSRRTAMPISTTLFRTPFFQSADGTPAPPAPSEIDSAELQDVDPPNAVHETWTDVADRMLLSMVTARKKEKKVPTLRLERKRLEIEITKLRAEMMNGETVDASDLARQIAEKEKAVTVLQTELDELPNMTYEDAGLGAIPLAEYDWDNFARSSPKLKRHGALGLQLRFLNKLDPALSKKPWSAEETDALKQLLDEHGLHNWVAVAHELPGRNAAECCRQYREKLSLERSEKKTYHPVVKFSKYTPEETIKLIHGLLVSGGVITVACTFLPDRTLVQTAKFWKSHLNLASDWTGFTAQEKRTLREYGRKNKSQNLKPLYKAFPNRAPNLIKHQFLGMFKLVKKRWVELDRDGEAVSFGRLRRQPYDVILHRLYEHVAEHVTARLREDPHGLSLEHLIALDEVMSPARAFLADLHLHSAKAPVQPDVPHSSRSGFVSGIIDTLSPLDRQLLELFSAPQIKKPLIAGRPRKRNPFGDIPEDLQAKTPDKKRAVIRTALTEQLLLPPSYCTMDALLKVKELCRDVRHVPETNALYDDCDITDAQTLYRHIQSLLLTSEVLVQHQHRAKFEEEKEDAVAVDAELGVESLSEAPSVETKGKARSVVRRKSSIKTQMAKRFKWFKDSEEKKKEERALKRQAKTAAVDTDEAEPSRKRRKGTAAVDVPVRQSSRRKKASAAVAND
ncbi:hypothetical protein BV898_11941 [Hypsibius exemplaris]|uniref:Uncharacterized protein n=1 Tax=Hypsibius exemplaris TaxID=2072580 RepID=A0A1W0WF72_HYPEX|nr:hypothetical protein BV898_11941 [Hypsibius exemplaris]